MNSLDDKLGAKKMKKIRVIAKKKKKRKNTSSDTDLWFGRKREEEQALHLKKIKQIVWNQYITYWISEDFIEFYRLFLIKNVA